MCGDSEKLFKSVSSSGYSVFLFVFVEEVVVLRPLLAHVQSVVCMSLRCVGCIKYVPTAMYYGFRIIVSPPPRKAVWFENFTNVNQMTVRSFFVNVRLQM